MWIVLVGSMIFFMLVFFRSSFQNLGKKVLSRQLIPCATSLPFVFLELLPTEVFGHVIRRQVGLVRHPHPVKPAEGDHQGLALEGCAVQVVPGQMIDYSIIMST